MTTRVLLTMMMALAVLVTLGACAENPADSVPAAQVSDTNAGDAVAQPPSGEEASGEVEEAGTEGEEGVADEAPADEDDDTAMTGKVIPLVGTIAAVGSKVTGSHYLLFEDWAGSVDPGAGTPETIAALGKEYGIHYFINGRVGDTAEKTSDKRRVQYFLFLRVTEVSTKRIVFQEQVDDITKLMEG